MPEMTFVSSLHAALQLSKALIGVRDAALIDSKVIELRDHLIEAQSGVLQAHMEQAALIQEVRDLKEKIVQLETWNKEKQRYQLVSPWSGIYVMALKESAKASDPPHLICANCYEKGRKEFLQNVETYDMRRHNLIKCPRCSFQGEQRTWADPQYAERYARDGDGINPK